MFLLSLFIVYLLIFRDGFYSEYPCLTFILRILNSVNFIWHNNFVFKLINLILLLSNYLLNSTRLM
jgi:hypothetical protein